MALQLLKERNANALFIIAGCMLREDMPELKGIGVGEVFPAETPVDNIVNLIETVETKGG